MTAATDVVKNFMGLRAKKEYILVNPSPGAVDLQDQGQTYTIPARDVVVEASRFHPNSPTSYQDPETKQYIPGTLVVGDRWMTTGMGGQTMVFDVETAIRLRLGLNQDTGEYTEPLGLRGLSVALVGMNRADIETIRKAGFERWEKWRVKEALDTVSAYNSKNALLQRAGYKPEPPDAKYMRAQAVIDQLQDGERKAAEEELGVAAEKDKAMAQLSVEDLAKAIVDNPALLKAVRAVSRQKAQEDLTREFVPEGETEESA